MKRNLCFLFLMCITSCASYNYAENVKMVSFDNDFTEVKAVGNVSGEDCTWVLFGKELGGPPTVEKAFINANKQASNMASAGFAKDDGKKDDDIRYINNVSTENTGFATGIVDKKCIVVKGLGYK